MSITCPRCGLTSHNPTDAAEGYCGHCHDWTLKRCAGGREIFSTRLGPFWSRPCPNEATDVLELTDGDETCGIVDLCKPHVLALNAERIR